MAPIGCIASYLGYAAQPDSSWQSLFVSLGRVFQRSRGLHGRPICSPQSPWARPCLARWPLMVGKTWNHHMRNGVPIFGQRTRERYIIWKRGSPDF
jgi:hypothetical protein